MVISGFPRYQYYYKYQSYITLYQVTLGVRAFYKGNSKVLHLHVNSSLLRLYNIILQTTYFSLKYCNYCTLGFRFRLFQSLYRVQLCLTVSSVTTELWILRRQSPDSPYSYLRIRALRPDSDLLDLSPEVPDRLHSTLIVVYNVITPSAFLKEGQITLTLLRNVFNIILQFTGLNLI